VSVALFAVLFAVPQYLQSVAGDDPISAGLRLLPMTGGLLVAGGIAVPAARVAGTRLTVTAGLALLAAGLGVLSQVHLTSGYGLVATGLALAGLGTGSAINAAMDSVMAAAGGDEAGAGASLNSTLRQLGGAVAVAVLGSILSASYARGLHPALTALPASQAAAAGGSISQAAQLAAHLGGRSGSALQAAAGTAYLQGMSIVMLTCAGMAAVAAIASLRYLPGRAAPGDTPSQQAPAAAA
jgi:Na+/melibiose symporter-like transporter